MVKSGGSKNKIPLGLPHLCALGSIRNASSQRRTVTSVKGDCEDTRA